jgi:hypothetical protein
MIGGEPDLGLADSRHGAISAALDCLGEEAIRELMASMKT